MATPKKVKEPAGAKLSKFRVGYSVKWNFNGILEVEAENAGDAEKQAQAQLDAQADDGEFDDTSDFKAEFDSVDVLDTEEAEDYGEECRHARQIAECSRERLDGETAAKVVAEAVVCCKAHPVVCMGDGMISFDYDNSFGPTVAVDDVLERMNMRDWRMACDEFCKCMLRKGGYDPENFDWPTPLPKVMKVPEDEGTDVIARVCVTFKVDMETYHHILSVVNKEDDQPDDPDADGYPDDRGEETCCECDVQIRYRVEKGKTVVTCPGCGAINPLCSECTRPERENNACDKCELYRKCEELNRLRAEPRAGEEE